MKKRANNELFLTQFHFYITLTSARISMEFSFELFFVVVIVVLCGNMNNSSVSFTRASAIQSLTGIEFFFVFLANKRQRARSIIHFILSVLFFFFFNANKLHNLFRFTSNKLTHPENYFDNNMMILCGFVWLFSLTSPPLRITFNLSRNPNPWTKLRKRIICRLVHIVLLTQHSVQWSDDRCYGLPFSY